MSSSLALLVLSTAALLTMAGCSTLLPQPPPPVVIHDPPPPPPPLPPGVWEATASPDLWRETVRELLRPAAALRAEAGALQDAARAMRESVRAGPGLTFAVGFEPSPEELDARAALLLSGARAIEAAVEQLGKGRIRVEALEQAWPR